MSFAPMIPILGAAGNQMRQQAEQHQQEVQQQRDCYEAGKCAWTYGEDQSQAQVWVFFGIILFMVLVCWLTNERKQQTA